MSNIMRPFSFVPVFNDLDKEFNKLLGAGFESAVETSDWQPTVDILEETNQFTVKVDIPGVEPQDIEVSLDNNVLTIKGEKENEHREKRDNFVRYERSKGTFYRRILLPDVVDGDKIKAKSKNGVLMVVVPKSEKGISRKIKVEE